MSQKKNSLISGVAILSVAGILAKVIGMVFRVPLSNMIGSSGMGIYSAVYNVYSMLVAISTAGIPVAISRLVSENVTTAHPREARAVLRTAVKILLVLGVVLSLILIVFAHPLAARIGDPDTAVGYMAIAPSILMVSLMSAFRGYMQGRSKMAPTAVSQIIEAAAKVIISYPLASLGMRVNSVYAAAGALLGISIGEGLALLYMFIIYMRNRKVYQAEEAADIVEPSSFGVLAKRIIGIAIPIIIGAMIVPMAQVIDSSMTLVRLQSAGFVLEDARSLYGLLSGFVLPLINVPTGLAMAVCVGLVPAISSARIENRVQDMQEHSNTGLRLASLIGFPCAAGMSLLATPIIHLIYPSLSPHELAIAGRILAISAWTIILFTHVQATTGILQGAGMHQIPMFSLIVGVLCKIALNYFLIATPTINIYGAPVSSLVCYAVSVLINMVWIVRKSGMRVAWGDVVLRPVLATLGMSAAVLLLTQLFNMQRRFSVLLIVMIAILVYAVLVFAVGAMRREDMEKIPGGKKLEGLFVKLRIWR